jgi:glycosyltransferase involved in cell wall biosynthesis
MPVYNRDHIVADAISSILLQTDSDWELLVVDDGSTDASREVAASFTDPRISLLCHAENRGVQSAWATAIAAARGIWVLVLDSDDTLATNALQKLREVINTLPNEVGRVWFAADEEGCEKIDSGFQDGFIAIDALGKGDAGRVTRLDILKLVPPLEGLNGFEAEWNWKIRHATKEYFLDEVLYHSTRLHKTAESRLSRNFDKGNDLLSLTEQLSALLSYADPEFYRATYRAGSNPLDRYLSYAQMKDDRVCEDFIRSYATDLGISVRGPERLSQKFSRKVFEPTKRCVVTFLRLLHLKPPMNQKLDGNNEKELLC